MRKFIIALMFLVLTSGTSLTHAQSIYPLPITSLVPHIIFARATQYTYTPVGATDPITVNVLDINGFNLFKVVPNTMPPSTTIPGLKLGKVPLTVLRTVVITRPDGSELPNHQVIALVPAGTISGTYEMDFHNGERLHHDILSDITIGAVGPVGPVGPRGAKGNNGNIGATGPSGSSNLKKWVYFNGRTLTKNVQNGIGTITRSGHIYTINFSPAFPNANYVMADATSNGHCFIREQSAARVVIYCLNTSGQGTQADFINLAFFR